MRLCDNVLIVYLTKYSVGISEKCEKSFERLRNCLNSKPVLQLYNHKLPVHIFVGTSQVAEGAQHLESSCLSF